MKKTVLIIMIITIISKFVGFGREIVLSYLYGATSTSDAYLIALTIPGVVFSFIAAGLSAGYIPMYSKILQDDGIHDSNEFTSNLINIILVLSSLVIIVGFVFTEPIVRVFATGFKGDTLLLAVRLTKITLFAIYFSGIISVLTGFLQVNGNYAIPALIGMPFNFIIIVSLFVSQFTNVIVLGIGYVLAISSQVPFMLLFMKSKGFEYKLKIDFKDKHIVKMTRIIMPLIVSVSVNQINVLVDRTLASKLIVGGISALNFASKLNGFVQGIIVVSIVTALYPIISKLAAEKNLRGLKISIAEAIIAISILVLPATVGFIVFAKPIVSMLFGRGAFDEVAINLTSSALVFYSIGMIGFGLCDILTRAFYSLQDTKTPMIYGISGVIVNIALNLILSRFMGVGGLALATSISSILTAGLLFASLRQKIGQLGLKQVGVAIFKILISSLIMGLISKHSYSFLLLYFHESISLVIAIGVGVATYFTSVYFMKIKDVEVIFEVIKKKLSKGTL